MVVLKPQAEFGHAPPPQTPYSLITNLVSWDNTLGFREGDAAVLGRLVHIYPRFAPTHYGRELSIAIAKKLGMEDKMALMFLNPVMWPHTRRHVALPERGVHALDPDADVQYRCVELGSSDGNDRHRLYVTLFDPAKRAGIMLTWAAPGIGVSIRGAEMLLPLVDSMREVVPSLSSSSSSPAWSSPPEPTFTAENGSHAALRERISSLLRRAPRDPLAAQSRPEDVFLYPTGMAAVFHVNNALREIRPGVVVVLGVVFHNTFTHLREECGGGWEHFGAVDEGGLDELEGWLDGEGEGGVDGEERQGRQRQRQRRGRDVSYLIVEFPGNPTLETPDLKRLKKLSEKHSFVLIVDETVGTYANVDVLPHADLLLTSLTKSFSGRADVMGGALALNPSSPHHATLSSFLAARHRNELFAPDADVLLRNSASFLQRQAVLDTNASLLAAHLFAAGVSDPSSPVTLVQHPSVPPSSSSKPAYDAHLRLPTPDHPSPGHGCLLTVEFEDVDSAKVFHDACGFYPSPHLGAHVTVQFAYNMATYGKRPGDREPMRRCGVREESVRVSVGLEDARDIIDTVDVALEAARKFKAERASK
ncbi:hypothetical protein N3K66_001383 [Trichothecium roseum]|uniref:Uncharacterized protein n=1 Tax=Trichothecium roseum TaxID=47278 RepID=A0ACC0VEL9_9HYPO|nr:hypothetical protein N3K66_001383 [Trichothecium roseum]